MRFPTMWYVRPAKPQISLRKAQSDQSLCLSLEYTMIVKLLTEHHLEFLSLKGGCRGSSKSTFVKMSNCWKSHAAAQFLFIVSIFSSRRSSSIFRSSRSILGHFSCVFPLPQQTTMFLVLRRIPMSRSKTSQEREEIKQAW